VIAREMVEYAIANSGAEMNASVIPPAPNVKSAKLDEQVMRTDGINDNRGTVKPIQVERWRWLFAPAWAIPVVAVVVLGVGVGVWRTFFYQSELGAAQVALRSAYNDWRSHEARVTGFDYAQLDQTRDAAASDPNYAAREH